MGLTSPPPIWTMSINILFFFDVTPYRQGQQKQVCFPSIRVDLPFSLLPDHDSNHQNVADEPPHHAEDVDPQVEPQLWHCGPGVSHGLRRVITN